MTIPAKQRKVRKDALQRQRTRTGAEWEQQLVEELDALPAGWARCWPKAWQGQPFDISACLAGRPFAIECKSIRTGNLRFSALRPNEIENLERFYKAGGVSVVAVRRQEPTAVAFIPWADIRERILAGDRGSMPLSGWPADLAELLQEVL